MDYDFVTSSVGFDLQIPVPSLSACNCKILVRHRALPGTVCLAFIWSVPVKNLLLDIFCVNFVTLDAVDAAA